MLRQRRGGRPPMVPRGPRRAILTVDSREFLQFVVNSLTVDSNDLADKLHTSTGYIDQKFYNIMRELRAQTGWQVKHRGDAVLIALSLHLVEPPRADGSILVTANKRQRLHKL